MPNDCAVKDNVDYLPIWKKGATAAERLEELAMVARKHPQRFEKFAIVYIERDEKDGTKVQSFEHNCQTPEEVFGLYELAKFEYFKDSRFK